MTTNFDSMGLPFAQPTPQWDAVQYGAASQPTLKTHDALFHDCGADLEFDDADAADVHSLGWVP